MFDFMTNNCYCNPFFGGYVCDPLYSYFGNDEQMALYSLFDPSVSMYFQGDPSAAAILSEPGAASKSVANSAKAVGGGFWDFFKGWDAHQISEPDQIKYDNAPKTDKKSDGTLDVGNYISSVAGKLKNAISSGVKKLLNYGYMEDKVFEDYIDPQKGKLWWKEVAEKLYDSSTKDRGAMNLALDIIDKSDDLNEQQKLEARLIALTSPDVLLKNTDPDGKIDLDKAKEEVSLSSVQSLRSINQEKQPGNNVAVRKTGQQGAEAVGGDYIEMVAEELAAKYGVDSASESLVTLIDVTDRPENIQPKVFGEDIDEGDAIARIEEKGYSNKEAKLIYDKCLAGRYEAADCIDLLADITKMPDEKGKKEEEKENKQQVLFDVATKVLGLSESIAKNWVKSIFGNGDTKDKAQKKLAQTTLEDALKQLFAKL